jgi:hypothetical protein
MTHKQAQMLQETHTMVDNLLNKIRVNGEDGSEPIVGIEKILEAHHGDLKNVHKKIAELTDLTKPLSNQKELRKSIFFVIRAFVTSFRFWIAIAVAILSLFGYNHWASIVKFLSSL